MVSQEDMGQAVFEHFLGIFGRTEERNHTINLAALEIAPANLSILDLPFTTEEVWAAISELPADRAPGPDGFTGTFYKASWEVIRGDIMVAIDAFTHADCRNLRKLNNALVVLLPKKPDALEASDYRPITMIHSFAKLISKLLSLRLAKDGRAYSQEPECIRARSDHPRQLQIHSEGGCSVPQAQNTNDATQAGYLQSV